MKFISRSFQKKIGIWIITCACQLTVAITRSSKNSSPSGNALTLRSNSRNKSTRTSIRIRNDDPCRPSRPHPPLDFCAGTRLCLLLMIHLGHARVCQRRGYRRGGKVSQKENGTIRHEDQGCCCFAPGGGRQKRYGNVRDCSCVEAAFRSARSKKVHVEFLTGTDHDASTYQWEK